MAKRRKKFTSRTPIGIRAFSRRGGNNLSPIGERFAMGPSGLPPIGQRFAAGPTPSIATRFGGRGELPRVKRRGLISGRKTRRQIRRTVRGARRTGREIVGAGRGAVKTGRQVVGAGRFAAGIIRKGISRVRKFRKPSPTVSYSKFKEDRTKLIKAPQAPQKPQKMPAKTVNGKLMSNRSKKFAKAFDRAAAGKL